MTDGRKQIARVLATLCITALSGTVLIAAPTYADPDISTVQSKVDKLYQQAEQASERYNDARLEMTQAQTRLAALQADLDRQQTKVDSVREQVAAAVVSQYQGQALSSTTQVLLSQNPDEFLDQLTTVSEYNDQQRHMMADFAVQAKQLEMRQAAAKRELDRIAATKQELGHEKLQIDARAAEAKDLLSTLKDRAAEAAAARASRSRDRAATTSAAPAVTNVAASGRAGAAVRYALGQVGDAYVYGAAGPSAFDCSGLTMMAWAQAGVGLPHSSGAQLGSGPQISQSQLQPGDLVFYYSPVSHVGMYIGNGMIVHAANPGSGVTTAPVNSMPYSGAVRPG
ncbi:MAG: NlpC/P60 family protein [Nocardioidaceae bacterium]